MPAGTRFMLLVAAANRDESVFDDPDEFRLDRFADNAPRQFTSAGSILPFGAGLHHCTGAGLVRVEMRHALGALLDRASSAAFVRGVPQPEGFLLRSPVALDVTLQPAS